MNCKGIALISNQTDLNQHCDIRQKNYCLTNLHTLSRFDLFCFFCWNTREDSKTRMIPLLNELKKKQILTNSM